MRIRARLSISWLVRSNNQEQDESPRQGSKGKTELHMARVAS